MPIEGVHVSGVGALGAFLLWELHARGVPFTWDDAETPYNSWMTSTGGAMPYADTDLGWYAQGYRDWLTRLTLPHYAPFVEQVPTVFAAKSRPAQLAKGTLPVATSADGVHIWVDQQLGIQLHVQAFVQHTRETFKAQRLFVTDPPAEARVTVRCHGVFDPGAVPVWGWSLPVTIRPMSSCPFWPATGRPCLRFTNFGGLVRRFPVEVLYFQPVGVAADWWWAGSERLVQKQVAALSAETVAAKVATFFEGAQRVWGAWLDFTPAPQPAGQGWRPRPKPAGWRTGDPQVTWLSPTVLAPRPQGGNGVQCGPLVATHLVAVLQRDVLHPTAR